MTLTDADHNARDAMWLRTIDQISDQQSSAKANIDASGKRIDAARQQMVTEQRMATQDAAEARASLAVTADLLAFAEQRRRSPLARVVWLGQEPFSRPTYEAINQLRLAAMDRYARAGSHVAAAQQSGDRAALDKAWAEYVTESRISNELSALMGAMVATVGWPAALQTIDVAYPYGEPFDPFQERTTEFDDETRAIAPVAAADTGEFPRIAGE